MFNFFNKVLLFIFLINIISFAKNKEIEKKYLWPIKADINQELTSSFNENRVTHLHAGIDIRTIPIGKYDDAIVGYPVIAVTDGYIERITTSPYGYGKTLYLKHNDGYSSFYAHLDDFNEKILKIVNNEQLKNKNYCVDISLKKNEIKVKKGEIIAYSGETGVGAPHLHFEIFDNKKNNINPLLFYDFKDFSAPKIKNIALLSYDEEINFEKEKMLISREEIDNGGAFFVNEGKYYLSAEIFDYCDYNEIFKCAPYSIELYNENKLIFKKINDKYNPNFTNLAQFYFNNNLGRYYINLFDINENYKRIQGFVAGKGNNEKVTNLKIGKNEFKLVVKDLSNNSDSLLFYIYYFPKDNAEINVEKNIYFPNSKISNFINEDIDFSLQDEKIYIYCYTNGKSIPYINVKSNNYNFTKVMEKISDYKFNLTLDFKNFINDTLNIKIKTEKNIFSKKIFISKIFPDKNGIIEYEGFNISYEKKSVFKNELIMIERIDKNNYKDGEKLLSDVYFVKSTDFAFNKKLIYSIKLSNNEKKDAKIGIYKRNNNLWSYFNNEIDEKGYIYTLSRNFGEFALLKDEESPNIILIKPKNGEKITRKLDKLELKITDNLTGINYIKSNMNIDGKYVVSEYDPEKNTLIHRIYGDLSKGNHEIYVEIYDWADNMKTIKYSFLVE